MTVQSGGKLVPLDEADAEALRSFALGSWVSITVNNDRSLQATRFYWRTVELIAGALGLNKNDLSDELLLRTGNYRRVISWATQTITLVPKRISEMGDAEFKEYLKAAVDLLAADYVEDMTSGDLKQEMERILNMSFAHAMTSTRGLKSGRKSRLGKLQQEPATRDGGASVA